MYHFRRTTWFWLAAFWACAEPARPTPPNERQAPTSPEPEVAPHGGILAETHHGHLELVAEAQQWRLYPYDHQLQPRTPAEWVFVRATGNAEPRRFLRQGDHYFGEAIPRERVMRVVVTLPGDDPELATFELGAQAAEPSRLGLPHARPEGERVVGGIIDAKCLAEGKDPGPEHAECALSCIKSGSPIALVEEGTKQAYVLVPGGSGGELHELLVGHLGQRIEAYGKKTKRAGTHFLEVNAVIAEHDHTALHGGQVAMAGALHLEVVLSAEGELWVYLSDAFRKPLDARRYRGTAEFELDGAEPVPLSPTSGGEHLSAKLGVRPTKPIQVTVRLPWPTTPTISSAFCWNRAAPRPPHRRPRTRVIRGSRSAAATARTWSTSVVAKPPGSTSSARRVVVAPRSW
ncbi:MAG: hypothetical protein IPG45_13630 [Deltaproteobacteria bacterium]|nr:hypothetical protein [Deltaproteobacteria bacterium]